MLNHNILTPQHDCWNLFVERLDTALDAPPCDDLPQHPPKVKKLRS